MGFRNRQRIQVTKDGPNSRRLLALAARSCHPRRPRGDCRGEIVRDWAFKFNARGPDGLLDRTPGTADAPGRRVSATACGITRTPRGYNSDREREFFLSRALRLVKQVIIVIRPRFASISSRSSFFTRRATRFDRRHANRRRETLVRPGLLFAHFAPRRYLAFRPGTIRRRQ